MTTHTIVDQDFSGRRSNQSYDDIVLFQAPDKLPYILFIGTLTGNVSISTTISSNLYLSVLCGLSPNSAYHAKFSRSASDSTTVSATNMSLNNFLYRASFANYSSIYDPATYGNSSVSSTGAITTKIGASYGGNPRTMTVVWTVHVRWYGVYSEVLNSLL